MNQTARVRIDNILSEKCEIGRGNRQGCPLSALLYILYDEETDKDAHYQHYCTYYMMRK